MKYIYIAALLLLVSLGLADAGTPASVTIDTTTGKIINTVPNPLNIHVSSGQTLTIDSGATIANSGTATGFGAGGGVTTFNTRTGAVTLTTTDVNAVGPLTLNITGNVTGNVSGSAGALLNGSAGTLTTSGTGVIVLAGSSGTLNIGPGGTLGSNAFTSTAYAPLASPALTGTPTINGSALTLGGALTTSGAFSSTFTMTGATMVAFPTTGTLATTTGSVANFTGNLSGDVTGTQGATVVGKVNGQPFFVPQQTYFVRSQSNGIPNTKFIFDAIYTSGSTGLTSSTANFSAGDVGKTIVLPTTTSARQITTIATVTNSTTIVLNITASSSRVVSTITGATNASPIVFTTAATDGLSVGSVINILGITGNTNGNGYFQVATVPSGTTFTCNYFGTTTAVNGNSAYVSGGTVQPVNCVAYGTDNTTAIQAAITAAFTAGGGYVQLDSGNYMVTTAPSNATGGNTNNSIFYIPQDGVNYTSIAIEGTSTSAFSFQPSQVGGPNPSQAVGASVLYCPNTTVSGTLPAVFATAGSGYASFGLTNCKFSHFSIMVPGNPSLIGIQWVCGGGIDLEDYAYLSDVGSFALLPNPTSGGAYGVITPKTNNPAWCHLRRVYVEGCYDGIELGEHADADGLLVEACVRGLSFSANTHSVHIGRACVQWCIDSYNVSVINAGTATIEGSELDSEEAGSAAAYPLIPSWAINAFTVNDAGNQLRGWANFAVGGSAGSGHTAPVFTGGVNLGWRDLKGGSITMPSANGGTPVVTINNLSANAFAGGLRILAPNLTTGQSVNSFLGVSATTGNEGGLAFTTFGNNNATNNISMTIQNGPYSQSWYQNGTTSMSGTLTYNTATASTSAVFNSSKQLVSATAGSTFAGNNGTPTVVYGTGANTPTATSIVGNGESGTITFTTGATPATASTLLTATFASSFAYANGSTVVIYPGNGAAALLTGTSMLNSTGNTTTFVLTSGTAALTGLTTYILQYQVKGY